MHKRIVAVFCVITLLMTLTMYRIYYIDASDYLAMAASVQGEYGLQVSATRGGIYDRNFTPLVNNEHTYVAAVLPTPQAAAVLQESVEEEQWEALLQRLSGTAPFVMAVEDQNLYATGIDVFRVPVRYGAQPVAPHLVGYLGGDNLSGVAGIERAYDSFLQEQGSRISAVYQVDAVGQALHGGNVQIRRTNEGGRGGVVLSIDKEIQLITQNALQNGWDKGAAVVLDVDTGEILAMASGPAFDQNDIAASLDSEDAPFINRAISGYNIGSVFKLVVAAAALENNISRYHEYECQGLIDVDGQVFRCNNHAVHGVIDMERALEVSCNTYFIDLAKHIDSRYLLALCEQMGIGSATELAPEFFTQSGNLPSPAELSYPAGLANFSFGQGSSLATPLQMAQVVSTIAGGGFAVSPRLVRGFTLDGTTLDSPTPIYATNRILSERTAGILQELMIAVIEEGSGKPARPLQGGAGGKTSSAQTGQMIPVEDEEAEDGSEKEIVHAWFAGFYPAQQPKYAIVVFCEGGESGEQVAAPIFKAIADGISGLRY